MTWTKQSDDFADDCWCLSDEAYRLHDEGLIWSNRKLLDCRIPKDDLRRFAKRPEAVSELLAAGFWRDDDECYVILHHAGYQPTREQVIQRQAANVANGRRGGRPRKNFITQPVSESVTQQKPASSTQSETQPVVETQRLGESVGDSPSETGTQRDGSTDVLPSETVTSRSVGGSGGKSTRQTDPRGHRLPDEWWPTDADRQWFRESCPALAGCGSDLTEEFRDYWHARAGKEARKVDWSKTWKNRMREKQRQASNRELRPVPDRRQSASDAAASRVQALRRTPRTSPVPTPQEPPRAEVLQLPEAGGF